MPGRKLLPDSVKIARGTMQKCRKSGKINISMSATIPQPPQDMTDEAKAIYFDTANELFTAGLFQKIGLPPMLMYCNLIAAALDAERHLKDEGRVITVMNDQGNLIPKVNPYHRVSIECFNSARSIMAEYGITPSGQAKLASMINRKKDEKDEFDDI